MATDRLHWVHIPERTPLGSDRVHLFVSFRGAPLNDFRASILLVPNVTIDAAHELLHAAGWSTGEMAYQSDGRLVWQVNAHRGADHIVVRARSQAEAWQCAAESAKEAP